MLMPAFAQAASVAAMLLAIRPPPLAQPVSLVLHTSIGWTLTVMSIGTASAGAAANSGAIDATRRNNGLIDRPPYVSVQFTDRWARCNGESSGHRRQQTV